MARKTGNWLIGIGCFIAFLGLCVLPAAFGPNADKTLQGASMTIVSTGIMLIAGGLYLKARSVGEQAPDGAAANSKRGRKATCERCGKREPVIQCRVHHLHLCGDCLSDHYDFRSCAYVPSTRRGTTKAAALKQASGA